jgi:hypothetical protein
MGCRWIALIACVGIGGCAPYRIDHRHLVLEPMPGLEVHRRSTPADSPGEELRRPRYGLPLECTLRRDRYTVVLSMPLGMTTPMLFVGAHTPLDETLVVEGAHLRGVHPDAREANADHPYTFMVEEAEGKPLQITIRERDGTLVGRETLRYRIVSRGVASGIEWI